MRSAIVLTAATAAVGSALLQSPSDGTALSGNVTRQTDFMIANTTAPWGTTYACFRVPTAVTTADGTIVVLAESRIGDCGDQAPKDITSRRSADGGLTWSDLQLVVGPTAHSPNASSSDPDFTARNPYATLLPNGTIILEWVNSTDAKNCKNMQQSSDDTGATWTEPVEKDFGKWEGVLFGPGTGIVLGTADPSSPHKGRVLACGATGYVGGMPMVLPIYYSDDNGDTYTEAGGSAPFSELQECQLVELNDGSVMVNARNSHLNKTCNCRAVATSTDGGETWSDYSFVPDLVEPVCSAGLINVDGSLYFSNPASATARVNMTLKRSDDGGNSWQEVALVFGGMSEYSVLIDMTNTNNGTTSDQCRGVITSGTRPGQDYASIKMNSSTPTAEECQEICCNDERCETFVFVPDGLYPQRPPGTFCWLKEAAIPLKGDT